MNTLTAARTRLAETRATHAADRDALTLGRQRLADAQADLDRLAAEDQAAIERHAKRLTQHARAGNTGPVPSVAPSDKHIAAQIAARHTHAAATAAVANLEAAERESASALAAAETATREAALDVLRQEADAIAEQILARDAETEAMRWQLRGLGDLVKPTPAMRRATGDWLNTPLAELDQSRPGTEALHTVGGAAVLEANADAEAHWQRRLADLLAGDDQPTPAEAAA